jgi:GTPase SAR1 family protein
MKIGILGAPGAGKTKFAHELRNQLYELGYTVVINGYVEELRKNTGLEYGLLGNHIDDYQVVFKRRERELRLDTADNTITCGTVLDSVAHCFARSEDRARNSRELTLTSERLRTIAESFGLLYTETWDYDYAFYLPYLGEDPDSRLIDVALVQILTTYAAPVFSFKTEVTHDEKASIAAKAIRAIEAEQFPATDERRVQPGGEAREEDGDSAESVPDVPQQGRDSDDA